ncbi:MAG: TIGR02099 family protein [Gammaproteobacteria bacterium]|nr:MAG: TIGR02099 family protein [Gammaproteobacteria bacterium]
MFKRIYHFFLYSFAFVILTSAILITVIRLALPGIGGYSQQTQDWISQYMDYPVEISSIDADWNSWTPNLRLHQVSILDPASNEHILDFGSVLISIDIYKSLVKNEIIPRTITVSGLSMTLIRRQDGSVTATKYLPDDFSEKQLDDDALAKWFLVQKNILVKKAQITLLDLKDEDAPPLLLSDATLRIRNNDYRTQIEGSAVLPGSYGHILDFALDASGDVLTPEWSGEVYFAGKDINISPLFSKIEALDIENHEGTGDIKLWSTWNRAKLRNIEGQVKLKNLKLADKESEIYINQIEGNFSASRRTDKGIEVSLDLQKLVTPNGEWPETVISLKKIYIHEHDKYRYIASASYLDLDNIDSFLDIFSDLSEEFYPSDDFNITGILQNSLIKYDPTLEDDKRIYIDTEFLHLGGSFRDHPLKLDGLYGQLQGTRKEGSIHIESSTAQLDLKEFLANSLTFYELNTELNWQYHNNNLVLSTEQFDTHTQDFDLNIKGNLRFDEEAESPFLNLLVELSDAEVETVSKYLPKNSPEKSKRWFKRALVSGKIPSAEFVFRGRPKDYPFRDNDGVFQGYAEVNLETLDYHPLWPPADGINAGIMVSGDTVTIDVQSGYFFNAEITGVSAVIKDLSIKGSKKSVALKTHINGDMKDFLLFIKNSPLKKTPSLKNLPSRNFTGGMGIDLAMEIPLFPSQILFNGSLTLRDATFSRDDIKIELTDLNGRIDFSRGFISAKGMKANFFNSPVELAMENRHGFPSRTTLTGTADNQFISAQLLRYLPWLEPYKSEIEKRINGSCSWEVSQINAEPDSGLKVNEQFVLTSSLTGLSIDVPAPLAKTVEPAAFKLSIRYPELNKREVTLDYANILNGLIHASDINDEKSVITSLSFGDKATIGIESHQYSINGDIDQIDAGDWIKFISDISDIEKEKKKKDIALGIQVGSLELGRQIFSDVNLKIEDIVDGFHFNLTADDIAGDFYLKHINDSNNLKINLQKLNLAENISDNEDKEYEIYPASIPPLDIEVSELSYNGNNLGRLLLTSSKTIDGLTVDNINISKTDIEIDGSGIWNLVNHEHHSKFNLTLNATSMATMLETFAYDISPIEKGVTSLTLDAQWPGTPMDFSLSNLDGTLYMEVDKGRFIEINPSAGRLFGLLSLQTLPRRLSLDFSDLFGKGLAFDSIEGRFNIEDGNAYTNNLAMTGPSVNINISGRSGLVEQDYDQIATVTPQITDSLPVASALFGPVGIGVGAIIFLASEIFQSLPDKINTLLRKQYTITGAWDEPQVTKIKKAKEDKDKG